MALVRLYACSLAKISRLCPLAFRSATESFRLIPWLESPSVIRHIVPIVFLFQAIGWLVGCRIKSRMILLSHAPKRQLGADLST